MLTYVVQRSQHQQIRVGGQPKQHKLNALVVQAACTQ